MGGLCPPFNMAKQIIDHDPETHTTQYHHYDPVTGVTTIETVQDVEPYLKRSRELRNDDDYSRKGIKNDMWHYASIPNSVIEKIMQDHGLNIFDKDHAKAVLRIINAEYPYLKTTRKHHG